ncbi:MAG: arylesterase [Alphaproteobacteria bacterium]|nr:arylesterase [Alphaproteobacteria bacterium]
MVNFATGPLRAIGAACVAAVLICGVPASAAAEPVRILVLGDSLSAGYGLPAEATFPAKLEDALRGQGVAAEVLNAGVSGDTTAGGRARLGWALGDDPDIVIVELGGNDGLRGIDPEETYRNLDAILARLRAAEVGILFTGMYAPPNMGREYGDAYRAVFERLAAEHAVDFYPFFLDGVAAEPELNQNDGIHPNEKGVDIIVERILPAVTAVIERHHEG